MPDGRLDNSIWSRERGEYATSGTYTVPLTGADGIIAWNYLQASQEVPTGTSATYSLLDSTCTDVLIA